MMEGSCRHCDSFFLCSSSFPPMFLHFPPFFLKRIAHYTPTPPPNGPQKVVFGLLAQCCPHFPTENQ